MKIVETWQISSSFNKRPIFFKKPDFSQKNRILSQKKSVFSKKSDFIPKNRTKKIRVL
jgi:hypothetical protein